MIRNVVFDMGNVLIRFDPVHFVERAGVESPEDRKALLDAIFFSPEWPGMDRGDLDEPELYAIARRRLPERRDQHGSEGISAAAEKDGFRPGGSQRSGAGEGR